MEPKLPIKSGPRSAFRRVRLPTLILAAAVLHVSVTTAVFTVGKLRLMPGQFNEMGLGTFASDGFMYQTEVAELCQVKRARV
jgi:hypothetical protein